MYKKCIGNELLFNIENSKKNYMVENKFKILLNNEQIMKKKTNGDLSCEKPDP